MKHKSFTPLGSKHPRGFTLWFTGLPCSGKSTIADLVANRLKKQGYRVERLDGDIVRKSLSRDLGFSKEDRNKNIERVTFVSKLLTRNGVVVITSFVSPYRRIRRHARKEIGNFVEVYVKCPIEVCKERDVKGMYKKAHEGHIENFTGVSHPYEEPKNPEIIIDTEKEDPPQSTNRVINKLKELNYLRR